LTHPVHVLDVSEATSELEPEPSEVYEDVDDTEEECANDTVSAQPTEESTLDLAADETMPEVSNLAATRHFKAMGSESVPIQLAQCRFWAGHFQC